MSAVLAYNDLQERRMRLDEAYDREFVACQLQHDAAFALLATSHTTEGVRVYRTNRQNTEVVEVNATDAVQEVFERCDAKDETGPLALLMALLTAPEAEMPAVRIRLLKAIAEDWSSANASDVAEVRSGYWEGQ